MKRISVLIGGAAGDGVKRAGNIIARMFNRLGMHVFEMDDYQSLIRGGHNFSVVTACLEDIKTNWDRVEAIIALNNDTIKHHEEKLVEEGVLIFDSDKVTYENKKGCGIPLSNIIKQAGAPIIARTSAAIGALSYLLGIPFGSVLIKNS